MNGSPHVLAAILLSIGPPCTHCTVQWLDVRFALDALKRKISVPARILTFIAYYMNFNRHATKNVYQNVVHRFLSSVWLYSGGQMLS